MLYIINAAHYVANQGYTHTETIETGRTEKTFTAAEWNEGAQWFEVNDYNWVELTVAFYADDADPMFDDPISTDTCTI